MLSLGERLRGLALSIVPVWVYDHERLCFRWANAAALELWQASSLEDFLARDVSKSSASTRTRLDHYMRAVARGETVSEDWTLYPRGKPATMALHGSAITLDDGQLAILFQATLKEKPFEPSMVRATEALRHTSLLVSLHDLDGAVLFQNPAALRAFGDAASIVAWFPDEARALLSAVRRGEVFQAELQIQRLDGLRWHSLRSTPVVDPVTGGSVGLLQQLDVDQRRTAQDEAEARGRLIDELSRTVEIVEQQRREIWTLSAPILDVGMLTAAVPMIGVLSPERIAELGPRLLSFVQSERRRFVLLDLTGCHEVDGRAARALVGLAAAVELLGAQVVLTGIRANLAQALVAVDLQAGRLTTLRTLHDGIEHCRRALR